METQILKQKIVDMINTGIFEEDLVASVINASESNEDLQINTLMARLYSNWGNQLGIKAKVNGIANSDSFFYKAFEKFEKASKLDPNNHTILNNWGIFLGYQMQTLNLTESDKIKAEMLDKFEASAKLNPTDYQTYLLWGTHVAKLAGISLKENSEKYYSQAFELFQKAIKLAPENHQAYYFCGYYQLKHAERELPELRMESIKLAISFFENALILKSNFCQAFHYWGKALAMQTELEPKLNTRKLFEQAISKFECAIEIKSSEHKLWSDFSELLSKQAKSKVVNPDDTFKLAYEKIDRAMSLKSGNFDAYYHWGRCLMIEAEMLDDEESLGKYSEAITKFKEAIELNSKHYNSYLSWADCLSEQAKINSTFDDETDDYLQAFSLKTLANFNDSYKSLDKLKRKNGFEELSTQELFEQAFEVYDKSINPMAKYYRSFMNWGKSLKEHVDILQAENSTTDFENEVNRFIKKLDNFFGLYGIASEYAHYNEDECALFFLGYSLDKNLINSDVIKNDPIWERFTENTKFQELFNKH